VIEEAPAYGLIGQPVTIRLRIEDQGAVPPDAVAQPARLRISVDGEARAASICRPVCTLELPVVPEHAGQNVVSIAFDAPEASPPELTDRNNAAAIQIQGVHDRLAGAAGVGRAACR
jgi:hypothetical protein